LAQELSLPVPIASLCKTSGVKQGLVENHTYIHKAHKALTLIKNCFWLAMHALSIVEARLRNWPCSETATEADSIYLKVGIDFSGTRHSNRWQLFRCRRRHKARKLQDQKKTNLSNYVHDTGGDRHNLAQVHIRWF